MRRKLSVALVALLALSGCATLARQAFAPPVVEVKDVKVANIGLTGGTLNVTLSLSNPNEYRIDATRVTYRFFVDSTQIVSGEVDKLLTLENRGVSELVLPVNFGYRELGIAMREYTSKGALQYRVVGEFTLATPFGNITRPYSGTGRVQGMP
jgi:LEA14-like dessication related protein